jgi:hypothetical protein
MTSNFETSRLAGTNHTYVAVTDRDWFDTLSAQGTLDEVSYGS